jgi:pimeloyl-ACP methyl ester carboxylesterase
MQKRQIIAHNQLISYKFSVSENSKVTLIFLHGWRSSLDVWNKLSEVLNQKGYSVYMLDLPGFGESEDPSYPFSLEDFSGVIFEFIQKLSLKNITLIGHSNGGAISIKLDLLYPGLIDNLILINSSGIRRNNTDLKAKRIISKILKPFFRIKFMKPLKEKIYTSMGAEDYIKTPQLRDTYIKIINENLELDLKNLTARTLIIWGDKDLDTPIEMAYIMNKNIADSKLVVISNAGHFSFLDNQQQVEKSIVEFLESKGK